jgi:hypothetical protein
MTAHSYTLKRYARSPLLFSHWKSKCEID